MLLLIARKTQVQGLFVQPRQIHSKTPSPNKAAANLNCCYFYMSVLPACLSRHHMHAWCPELPEESIGAPRVEFTDCFETPRECWELNPGPLKEQRAFLITSHLSSSNCKLKLPRIRGSKNHLLLKTAAGQMAHGLGALNCSCRGPRFHSQQPHQVAHICNSSSRASCAPSVLQGHLCECGVHKHTQAYTNSTHN